MSTPTPTAELVELVKANLILAHDEDDALIGSLVGAATSYAVAYQHLPDAYYEDHPMSGTTRQAVILLATHFYELRDGRPPGFGRTSRRLRKLCGTQSTTCCGSTGNGKSDGWDWSHARFD